MVRDAGTNGPVVARGDRLLPNAARRHELDCPQTRHPGFQLAEYELACSKPAQGALHQLIIRE
ncbi:hypothetical protein D3C86_1897000 [compost metagenome]